MKQSLLAFEQLGMHTSWVRRNPVSEKLNMDQLQEPFSSPDPRIDVVEWRTSTKI